MYDGVSIFFTLSGFLIGGILLRTFQENPNPSFDVLWQFWKRRWLRTLPNYFLILTLLVIYFSLFRDFENIEVWKYYLFIQNLWQPQPWFFGESWSLSIEEWFYLFTPLALFLLIKILRLPLFWSTLLVAFGLIVFSTLQRLSAYDLAQSADSSLPLYNKLIRTQITTRLDSIMFGVLAACTKVYAPLFWERQKNVLMAIGLSLLVFYYFHRNDVEVFFVGIFGPTVIALGVAFILPYLSELKSGGSRLYKAITYISLTSYSAYLINLGIIQDIVLLNIQKLFPVMLNPQVKAGLLLVLFFGFTFLGSILLYKYFELPVMKLRDRRVKSLKN